MNGQTYSNDYQMYATAQYASDIGTALINAASSRKERKAAQRHAEEMALEAYQRDIEFWEKQNEYNSPLQKRLRLEEAGISPWTEFGQMNSEADAIKSPVASTIPPTEGLKLPMTNLLGNYMAMKRQHMDMKMIQGAMEKQAVETEYKRTEAAILNKYYDKQLENDLLFSKAEQQEAFNEWYRIKQDHEEKMKEYQRNSERYEREKKLYKYEDKANAYKLDEQRRGLLRMEQDLKNMQLEAELLKQKYQIGEKDIQKSEQELKIREDEFQSDKFRRDRQDQILRDYGISPDDPWYVNKLGEVQKWIDSEFKLDPRINPFKGKKQNKGFRSNPFSRPPSWDILDR